MAEPKRQSSRPWKTVSAYPEEAEWRAWRQWALDRNVKMSSLVLAARAAAEIDRERRG